MLKTATRAPIGTTAKTGETCPEGGEERRGVSTHSGPGPQGDSQRQEVKAGPKYPPLQSSPSFWALCFRNSGHKPSSRAFGKSVPQNPNDEPAAVLLDRVRAERAQTPKRRRRKTPVRRVQ